MRLVLASGSPRRAELLRAARFDFDVVVADVDESLLVGETPEQHVRRLANDKARRVLARAGRRPVLAADTIVVVDDLILGKPADAADAVRMLRLLSGRMHQVMTGIALLSPTEHTAVASQPEPTPEDDGDWRRETSVAVTAVEFVPLDESEIMRYVDSGEPMDKAGAYAIQGFASRFVARIDGSYSNVVGLPVALVYELCKRSGLLVS